MKQNDLFIAEESASGLKGMHRILWTNEAYDLAFTIEVPPFETDNRSYYFKSPKQRSYQGIKALVDLGDLRLARLTYPGIMLMSDPQIQERYPPLRGKVPAAIKSRDRNFALIAPILEVLTENRRGFFEDGLMAQEILVLLETSQSQTNRVYTLVNRYLAFGIGKNGLMPFRYTCGGPGKERSQERRLGNKSKAYKAGLVSQEPDGLSQEDKQRIAWCWSAFVDGNNAVEDAYDLALGVYWSQGTKLKHGREAPLLLPVNQRPTLAQFRRWGPKGEGNKEAFETLLSQSEWEGSYRAREGTVLDGIRAIGSFGLCDATPNDLHLVSGTSRLKSIGSAVRLVIHDALTSMICGFDIGLEAPSQQTALLAVLSGATSKVELCRQYGIEIEEDDIPPIFFGNYLVDNGEFRTAHVRDVLGGLGSALELTPSYRGDRKGMSEAGHRSIHKLTGHKVSGTTKGRQRKRGESAPALEASWRFHEYMRLFLMAVVYYNTEQRVERFFNEHPFARAMRRDGVIPTRKEIYKWCVRQGYVASPPFHEHALRGALLPEVKAIVRETGVHLIRPDRGRKVELISGHRFLGPRVTELKWLERARRNGPFSVSVRMNPNHLNNIWFIDDLGLHELINVGADVEAVRKDTLVDALTAQDQDTENREVARQNTDQARTDFVVARSVDDDAFRREKSKEIKARPTKPTKRELTRDVRQNREEEKSVFSDGIEPEADVSDVPQDEVGSDDWLDDILGGHRNDE